MQPLHACQLKTMGMLRNVVHVKFTLIAFQTQGRKTTNSFKRAGSEHSLDHLIMATDIFCYLGSFVKVVRKVICSDDKI